MSDYSKKLRQTRGDRDALLSIVRALADHVYPSEAIELRAKPVKY